MTPLMKVLMIAVAAPSMALVQDPPRRPTPPAPPTPADVRVKPKIVDEFLYDFKLEKLEELKFHKLEEMKVHLDELKLHEKALDMAAKVRLNIEPNIHIALENSRIDMMYQRDVQQEAVRAARELDQQQREMAREQAAMAREQANMARAMVGVGVDKFEYAKPRAPWANEDPADSLYREAREALNRGEYRRAANTFSDVVKRFPKSQYALDCQYWEAFARYRVGTTDDLRQAQKLLEDPRLAGLRQNQSNVDVAALRARVLAALAARGDAAAARALQSEATQVTTCDREDVSVKAEALSALGQMDIASALPVVKKVLARRDECTVELRRRALYVIGRQPTPDATATLFDVAKNDTDQGVRREAMTWLSRSAGDQSIPMFEELLKTSTEEQTQRSAVNALGQMDSDRARRAIRAIIERTDVLERVRMEAISSMARDRDNRAMSADDMAYLRSLYTKVESARLKESVLSAVSRSESPENEAWLLTIARNANESATLRARALERLGRMTTVSFAEIGRLYENADSRALRQQILRALSERKEPEAIDKLVEVAGRDTDPNIRTYAIQILTRSNNPKALQGIKALVDKP
jgi:HEAT repeat protein